MFVAARVVRKPPGGWIVEVRSPPKWAGQYLSSGDGAAWWSASLDRILAPSAAGIEPPYYEPTEETDEP